MDMKITPLAGGSLYRTDRYSDMTVGEILVYVPIMGAELVEDPMRQRLYQGTSNLTFSNGQTMTVTFPIPAKNFMEAVEAWSDSLKLQLLEMESNATRSRILNGVIAGAPRQAS